MSSKISVIRAKKLIPSNVKGIAFDPFGKKKTMTYGEFLKIPKMVADNMKKDGKKIKSVTYWEGYRDEWEGISTAVDIKFNGKYEFTFIAYQKFTDSGKSKYMMPTKKNCHLLDEFD